MEIRKEAVMDLIDVTYTTDNSLKGLKKSTKIISSSGI
jgi:hypothetical protein